MYVYFKGNLSSSESKEKVKLEIKKKHPSKNDRRKKPALGF